MAAAPRTLHSFVPLAVVLMALTGCPGPNTPPKAPTDLMAVPVGESSVQLSWTDNARNEESFTVMGGIVGLPFVLLQTLGPDSLGGFGTGRRVTPAHDSAAISCMISSSMSKFE